jgi:hypothetical protein
VLSAVSVGIVTVISGGVVGRVTGGAAVVCVAVGVVIVGATVLLVGAGEDVVDEIGEAVVTVGVVLAVLVVASREAVEVPLEPGSGGFHGVIVSSVVGAVVGVGVRTRSGGSERGVYEVRSVDVIAVGAGARSAASEASGATDDAIPPMPRATTTALAPHSARNFQSGRRGGSGERCLTAAARERRG